ncbi:MAG TPA: TadE family protein [Bryobacteraceae bacterium]|nr:TadE family protein [Bryobacteraceae bacterium]
MNRQRQTGHALIEMAISLTVVVTLVSGIFQMGYVFYTYNQLVAAVANGARYAATAADNDLAGIRNVVVYGAAQPAANSAPLIANLKPDLVDVRWIKSDDGSISAVNVSVREFTVDTFFRVFRFSNRPGVEFPYIGVADPKSAAQSAATRPIP